MTETTEPTICPECAWGGGFHAPTCSQHFVMPFTTMPAAEAILGRDREAEYRRVWLDVAMRYYTSTDFMGSDPCTSFIAADRFLAELKKRDGG